eukprot:Hpha_TRINITY_DN35137_c0_g1::TRINITY_DN35137_c0_g1_i1::g.168389::m.168389/K08155/SLC18A1_2, VMAT; MFS transporter, DHA1 family, solute carrier family 18 (vesicular amine transporter), member 1/2
MTDKETKVVPGADAPPEADVPPEADPVQERDAGQEGDAVQDGDEEPDEEGSQSNGRGFLLLSVAFALFADATLVTLIIPLAPDMLPNESSFNVGLLFASKPAVQILANPIVGFAADRLIGPHLCMQLGMVVLAGSTAAFAISNHYLQMLGARAVQGIASACIGCGGLTMVAMAFPPDKRGGAAGQAQAGIAGGVLLGPAIAGAFGNLEITDKYPHAAPFLVVAGVVLLDFFLLWALALCRSNSKKWEKTEEKSASMGVLAKDSQIIAAMLCQFSANAAISLLEPIVPYYLKEEFNYSKRQRGLLWMVAPGSYFVATPIAGYVSDKFPKWVLLMMGLLIAGLGAPWTCMFPSTGVALTAVGLAAVGGGMSFVDTPIQPTLTEICDARHPGAYGSAFALADVASSLSFIFGPLVGSAVKQAVGPRWTLVGTGALLFMLLPVPLLLRRIQPADYAEALLNDDAESHVSNESPGRSKVSAPRDTSEVNLAE